MGKSVMESIELLKITKEEAELKIEGRLVGWWVSLLEQVCETPRHDKDAIVVLDFSGVSYADRNGVQLLHRLQNRGVVLQGCSPFLEALCRDI